MSLHQHEWDAAGGLACGACGEYRPEVYVCPVEGCHYRMFDASNADIKDHWQDAHAGKN